ncbi:MFS transporter [Rhodococcus aetherivorans]|uniref:MFS transporter n=1 Tax=Rhodococcus aetherivorans TaxID=191292 RepID=UPI0016398526|nr:MFS transporter [Rhodococcus aetherivorans]MBC2592370.1 MFS transporter [Rhodococcus aetherivorans]
MDVRSDNDKLSGKERSAGVVIAGLLIAEMVGAFESGMAIQLLYSNDPFFGTDIAKLSWVVTAYTLVAAAATGICGRLGDQFGRRKILIAVLLIATIGSLISALAPNVEIVIAGRAVQGVAACILPLTFGMARQALPQHKVALAVTLLGITASVAGASGILLSGFILDHFTWPVMFYLCAGLSVVACVSSLILIPRDNAKELSGGKVDYLGAVLFAAGVWAILFGITKSSEWGFDDSRTWSFIGVGALVMALLVKWELRVSEPVFRLQRFRNRKFTLTMLATAVCGFGLMGVASVFNKAVMRTPQSVELPDGQVIDLPVGLGFSATAASLPSVLGAVVGLVLSPLIARMTRTLGASRTVMLGSAVGAVGYIGFLFTHGSAVAFVINMVMLVGIGLGFIFAGLPMLIVECVPPSETSASTGMQMVVRTAFTGVGTSVVAVALALGTFDLGSKSFMSETGLRAAVLLGIAASVLSFLMILAASRIKTVGAHPSSTSRDVGDVPAAVAAE